MLNLASAPVVVWWKLHRFGPMTMDQLAKACREDHGMPDILTVQVTDELRRASLVRETTPQDGLEPKLFACDPT